jgi:hypothetical protein
MTGYREMKYDRVLGKELKSIISKHAEVLESLLKDGTFCLLCGSKVRVDITLTKMTMLINRNIITYSFRTSSDRMDLI